MDRATAKKAVYKGAVVKELSMRLESSKSLGHAADLGNCVKAVSLPRATAEKAVHKGAMVKEFSMRQEGSKEGEGQADDLGLDVKAVSLPRATVELFVCKRAGAMNFSMKEMLPEVRGASVKALKLPKLLKGGTTTTNTFHKRARVRERCKVLAVPEVTEEQPAAVEEVTAVVHPLRRKTKGKVFGPDFMKKQDLRREITMMDSPPATPPRPTERDVSYMNRVFAEALQKMNVN